MERAAKLFKIQDWFNWGMHKWMELRYTGDSELFDSSKQKDIFSKWLLSLNFGCRDHEWCEVYAMFSNKLFCCENLDD